MVLACCRQYLDNSCNHYPPDKLLDPGHDTIASDKNLVVVDGTGSSDALTRRKNTADNVRAQGLMILLLKAIPGDMVALDLLLDEGIKTLVGNILACGVKPLDIFFVQCVLGQCRECGVEKFGVQLLGSVGVGAGRL